MLNLIVLDNNREILQSSELQFGFKPKHSTSQCTMMLNKIIEYYHSNNTDTFVMMLDASKAFDRVNYYQLLSLLVIKRLCPIIIRLLLHLYPNQNICVKLEDVISQEVKVTNGIRQGGILSQVLFAFYIDQ